MSDRKIKGLIVQCPYDINKIVRILGAVRPSGFAKIISRESRQNLFYLAENNTTVFGSRDILDAKYYKEGLIITIGKQNLGDL